MNSVFQKDFFKKMTGMLYFAFFNYLLRSADLLISGDANL
jgi:hypothetical protein